MNRTFHPESLMMSFGYHPEWSEGALKCPIFQTSTFVFSSAEEGKAFFELAYGKREKRAGERPGLIYSRINNPDLEVLENRLCLWDGAEEGAVFESGMSAITTVLLEFLKPGDLLLYSMPLYGGTDHFIAHFLPTLGIHTVGFRPGQEDDAIYDLLRDTGKAEHLKMIFIETPANPTNEVVDIARCRGLADLMGRDDHRVLLAVDNTYMGPLWQHPLRHGADLVLYSATKYIGGHSDVIAGAVLGSHDLIRRIKQLRTYLGNMAGPWTGWLLLRSLETLKVRMEEQQRNAIAVARYLQAHPKVRRVHYPGLFAEGSRAGQVHARQCTGKGAMLSFDILGGEREAFAFLNALRLIRLAVSLGSTESLAEHPKTMTHAGLKDPHLTAIGIGDSLIRLSVGVENPEDLIADLKQALAAVEPEMPATPKLLQA